jgi:hypothetical protein
MGDFGNAAGIITSSHVLHVMSSALPTTLSASVHASVSLTRPQMSSPIGLPVPPIVPIPG